jgi:protein-tyrosine phosphatase
VERIVLPPRTDYVDVGKATGLDPKKGITVAGQRRDFTGLRYDYITSTWSRSDSILVTNVATREGQRIVAPALLVTLAQVTNRLVPFEGVLNFRDLGGYESEDGRRTRWGRLFRSDAMHDLTEDDLVVFRGLGIAAVVDLRSVSEVERTGRGLLALEAQKFVNVPVLSNYEIHEPREIAFDEDYLSRRYLQYLDVGAPAFVRVIEEMTIADNYPLVFNCFLGKDRTGVLAALVLSCLGVERLTVVEDYALTDARVAFIVEKLRRDPVQSDTIDQTDPVLLAAREATMTSFLAEVDERFGGPVAWARRAGVSSDSIERLHDLLLDEG